MKTTLHRLLIQWNVQNHEQASFHVIEFQWPYLLSSRLYCQLASLACDAVKYILTLRPGQIGKV